MRRLVRLTIIQKMLLGYAPLVLLLFLLAVFALLSLNRLNQLNRSIVEIDVPVVEAADRLRDVLLDQDLYGRRYVILRDAALSEVFWRRSVEFSNLLRTIRGHRRAADPALDEISSLHSRFDKLFTAYFEIPAAGAAPAQDRALRETLRSLLDGIQERSSAFRADRDRKIFLGAAIGVQAFWVTAALCALGVVVGGGVALFTARGIARSLRTLKSATQLVADGRFDQVPRLEGGEDLRDLSRAFEGMARKLKRMEATCLDANPLTRLPGGLAIENLLRRRMDLRWPMAFCLLDLDNFKAYGDRYGYARGSEVLRAVAKVIEEVVAQKGSEEDFLGHIGGDDFVLVTSPGRYEGLCSTIIERFDALAPQFYDEDDRDRGFIAGKTRQGEPTQFPLLSISIAVVTNPDFRFKDPLELGEVAAELKERAKSISGSVYVTDRQWRTAAERNGAAEG